MAARSRNVDREIGRLASRAHGAVFRGELQAAGVTRHEIQRRIESGRLLPVFRGVYRVGHRAPSTAASYMAAVKACGPGAVLSGLGAAHLLGLVERPPERPEVSAPTERRVPGIATRRSRHIERTTVDRIPVTTVARTLVAELRALLPRYAAGRRAAATRIAEGNATPSPSR